MATQNIRRNFSGSAQTAVASGTSATVIWASPTDWSPTGTWVVTVEVNVIGVGVSTEKVDAYYRRESFKWNDADPSPATVGALVAATIVEEDSSWDAHVVLNVRNIELHTVGDAVEKANWVWSGTITAQSVL